MHLLKLALLLLVIEHSIRLVKFDLPKLIAPPFCTQYILVIFFDSPIKIAAVYQRWIFFVIIVFVASPQNRTLLRSE